MTSRDPNCLFCKIADGEIPSETVYEDERYCAFRDIDPQAPTHVVLIPRDHIPTLNDITEAKSDLVGGMFPIAARIAADEGCAESGYRAVFNCNRDAAQSVFHIHLHILGGRTMTWPPG